MTSRWEAPAGYDYSSILEFIARIECIHDEAEDFDGYPEIDLTNSGLSPYTLERWLESVMGYELGDTVTNGWQWDFWTTMTKPGHKSLSINGTGATFELKLSVKEDEYL